MRLYELFAESASAGASSAGMVADAGAQTSKPRSQVGSLFGGTYKQQSENIISRTMKKQRGGKKK